MLAVLAVYAPDINRAQTCRSPDSKIATRSELCFALVMWFEGRKSASYYGVQEKKKGGQQIQASLFLAPADPPYR